MSPWIGPGERVTGGGGGGTFCGLDGGGIVKEGSPSNEDCIEVGREIGEVVLIVLGHPIEE